LQGTAKDRLRLNPRKEWWHNLAKVTADSELQATFHLKRPQPALITLLASGYSPIYPCHVPPAQMRQHPIGTGPFKFVEYKPNEHIKVAKTRITETGPALPRRHRLHHRAQPLDRNPRLHRQAVRHEPGRSSSTCRC